MSSRSHVRASAPSPSPRLVSRLAERASQDEFFLPPTRSSSNSASSSRLPSLSPPYSPSSRPTSSSDSLLISPPREMLFGIRPRKVSRKNGLATYQPGTHEQWWEYPKTAQDHMKDFTRAYRDAEVELADIERMSSLFPGLLALPDRRDSSPELSRPRYEEVINHEQSPSSSASGSSGHCSSPLPYDARPPSCPHSRYNSVFEDALPIPFSDPMMNYNPVGRDFLEFIPRRPALSMLVTESEGEFDAEWRDELGAWRVDSTLDLQPVIVEGLIGLGLGGI